MQIAFRWQNFFRNFLIKPTKQAKYLQIFQNNNKLNLMLEKIKRRTTNFQISIVLV